MSPEAVADLLHRFYDTAVSTLMPRDAIIDKFEGDSVMALFLPSFPSLGEGTVDVMMAAGIDLLERAGSHVGRHDLAIGVGMHFGPAFVGNVGSGEVKDFTAVGDVVNTAQRLQSAAEGGEIVISQDAFARLTSRDVNAVEVSLQLKGKDQPLRAWRVRVNA